MNPTVTSLFLSVLFLASPVFAGDPARGSVDVELRAEGHAAGVAVRWDVVGEQGILGYRVHRAPAVTGPFVDLTGRTILAEAGRQGGAYLLDDRTAPAGIRHYYLVEVVPVAKDGWLVGPVHAATAWDGELPGAGEVLTVVVVEPGAAFESMDLPHVGIEQVVDAGTPEAPVGSETQAEQGRPGEVAGSAGDGGHEPTEGEDLGGGIRIVARTADTCRIEVRVPELRLGRGPDGRPVPSLADYLNLPESETGALLPARTVLVRMPRRETLTLTVLDVEDWRLVPWAAISRDSGAGPDLHVEDEPVGEVGPEPIEDQARRRAAPVQPEPETTVQPAGPGNRSKAAVQERADAPTRSVRMAAPSGSFMPEAPATLDAVLDGGADRYGRLTVRPVQYHRQGRLVRVPRAIHLLLEASGAFLPAPRLEDGEPEEVQARIAGRPAVKVRVAAAGVTAVAGADLLAAGLHPSVDPRSIRALVDGREIPAFVTGAADGVLDPQDRLEFVCAQAPDAESDGAVAWVVAGGLAGRRVEVVQATPAAETEVAAFEVRRRVAVDPNAYYWSRVFGMGPEEPETGFVGWTLYAMRRLATRSLTIETPDLLVGGTTARVTASVVAIVDSAAMNPDHHVRWLINGVVVRDDFWDGLGRRTIDFEVASSVLRAGENVVTLEMPGDLGVPTDGIAFDRIEMDYPAVAAVGTTGADLVVQGPGRVRLAADESAEVSVWEVTDAGSPRRLVGLVTEDGGLAFDAGTALAFPAVYRVAPGGAMVAAGIEANRPSRLHEGEADAAHLIIAHPALLPAAERLAAWRRAGGTDSIVVDVTDVYDEFSFGRPAAGAIRAFLRHARRDVTGPRPEAVVFFGDGSYDPRNFLGLATGVEIPTRMIAGDRYWTASDYWFVAPEPGEVGDAPALGRVPAGSLEEAEAFVSKVIAYEGGSQSDAAAGRAVVCATGEEGQSFILNAEEIIRSLPGDVEVERVFLTEMATSDARAKLVAEMNAGAALVHYTGHGAAAYWARNQFFRVMDVRGLQNGGREALVVNTASSTGSFQNVYARSISEELLLKADGGAVAVWAATYSNYYSGARHLNGKFIESVFAHDGDLGRAQRAAWDATTPLYDLSTAYRDNVYTYVLFGDPATRIRVSAARP